MNKHIRSVIPFRTLPTDPIPASTREALVLEMANHLYAGVLGGLNTANDQGVISYLWNAPQRYHHRIVLDHMDDAMALAKRILAASVAAHG